MASLNAIFRATALVLALGASEVSAQQLKLASPQRGSWEGAVPELGQQQGIFRKHGLELDILYTAGGGETLQTVISGAVDIGLSAGTLAILGAAQKGAPVRIIGASSTGSRELFWYVVANSPVRQMRDANDKTIAYSTTGSSTNIAVLRFIDEYKLKAKAVATGDVSATITQVMTRQVDVGWSVAPFNLKPLERGQDPHHRARRRPGGDTRPDHPGADRQRQCADAEEGRDRPLPQGLPRNIGLDVCEPGGDREIYQVLRASPRTRSSARCRNSSRRRACRPRRSSVLDEAMADAVRFKIPVRPADRAAAERSRHSNSARSGDPGIDRHPRWPHALTSGSLEIGITRGCRRRDGPGRLILRGSRSASSRSEIAPANERRPPQDDRQWRHRNFETRVQPEQVLPEQLEIGRMSLHLLRHRVDVAEAPLERIVAKIARRAGRMVGGIDHVARLMRSQRSSPCADAPADRA